MTNYNPFSLEGKTILVTGASSGIGKATAIECAKMGASVVVSARNEERLQETLSELDTSCGQNHRMILADLTIDEERKNLVKECGPVQGLVLCPGKAVTLPMQFATPETYKDVFETNFFGPFETLRLLYKKKYITKSSSIVLIASIGGTYGFYPANGMYGTTKAALNSLCRFMALEFAPRKVRVNAICPGMVETPLINFEKITDEQLQADRAKYPLARYGKPAEIAYGAVYLLSDASAWTTGTSLVIDGGITMAW